MQFTDEDKFVEFMNAEQPLRPANIVNIVEINQGKRPLTMDPPEAKPMSADEITFCIDNQHIVVDTRNSAEFGAAHIPNAYNIQIASSDFEQRVGWVTPPDVPIVLVSATDAEAQRAIHLMAFLGLDNRVKGFLSGGMNAWMKAGKAYEALDQISIYDLYEHLQDSESAVKVLDVRESSEWAEGHIDAAQYMNFKEIGARLDELNLSPDDHIAIVCASGQRSSIAGSILLQHGFQHPYNVTGGMNAWKNAKLPTV